MYEFSPCELTPEDREYLRSQIHERGVKKRMLQDVQMFHLQSPMFHAAFSEQMKHFESIWRHLSAKPNPTREEVTGIQQIYNLYQAYMATAKALEGDPENDIVVDKKTNKRKWSDDILEARKWLAKFSKRR